MLEEKSGKTIISDEELVAVVGSAGSIAYDNAGKI